MRLRQIKKKQILSISNTAILKLKKRWSFFFYFNFIFSETNYHLQYQIKIKVQLLTMSILQNHFSVIREIIKSVEINLIKIVSFLLASFGVCELSKCLPISSVRSRFIQLFSTYGNAFIKSGIWQLCAYRFNFFFSILFPILRGISSFCYHFLITF